MNKNILEDISIYDIKPYKKNPRKNDSAVEEVKKSIQSLGYRTPITIDENNVILTGHTRYKAIKALGWAKVPLVVQYTDLNEEQKDEYRIRDNKTSEIAEWDYDILLKEFDTDTLKGFGFDLKDFPSGEVVEDEAPNVPETPRTVKGDLYQLGNHRVLCGDSTVITDVEKLMDGKKADMVFTDPPYGMGLDTDWSKIRGSKNSIGFKGDLVGNKYDKIIGDNEDFKPELINTIIASFDYVKEMFIFGADYFIDLLPNYGKDGCLLVWNKRSSDAQQRGIGNCFELFWSKQQHKKYVFSFEWFGFLSKDAPQEARNRVHPSMKPIGLISRIWEWYKSPEGICVDLYLGSGSTLIACEQTNRICYGMELDERYMDVIVQRWVNLTGGKVILNGKEIEWSPDKKTEKNHA